MSSRSERRTDEESAYRAIFEASSDGLVINDAQTGIVLEANPAFCRMHGYDQMVGLHPTVFTILTATISSRRIFAPFIADTSSAHAPRTCAATGRSSTSR